MCGVDLAEQAGRHREVLPVGLARHQRVAEQHKAEQQEDLNQYRIGRPNRGAVRHGLNPDPRGSGLSYSTAGLRTRRKIDREAMMRSDLDLVTGSPPTGQQYRPVPRAPAVARRCAREFLAEAGADRRCQQVAELLVSELVTNAVVHARTTARLSVTITGNTARVEVGDDGPGQPVLREPDHDHGGYGLWLVDWLAESWGTIPGGGGDGGGGDGDGGGDGGGKTVWFTVPLARASLSAA